MIHIALGRALPRPLMIAALLAVLVLAAALFGQSARADDFKDTTITQGVIAIDTVWTRAGSPYIVTTPMTITAQATLTIEAGVEVRFAPGTWLLVNGGLNAQGTQAQQVRMIASAGLPWRGIAVVQPSSDVQLQSLTVTNASTGLTIRQQGANSAPAKTGGRVDVRDSLFTSNGIGIDADYSAAAGAPRLTLRNNLLTNNQIGLQFNTLPNDNSKPKLNHNSFVGNGIGLKANNMTGKGLKAQQQWWGSADGPQVGDSLACTAPPPPGSSTGDLICGLVDFAPWSKVPAGRAIVPVEGGQLESAVGLAALSDDDVLPTSLVTLTVPAGSFAQPVDLLISGRAPAELPPVPPGLQPTQLFMEVTAVANGQEMHTFLGGKQLVLEIHYTPEDLAGRDPSKLTVYYYDERSGTWSTGGITSTPDPANHQIVAQLQHLTRLGTLDVKPGSSTVWLPLVRR